MNQIIKQNKETTMEKVANTNATVKPTDTNVKPTDTNVKPTAPVSEAQKNEHAANKDAEFKAKKAAAAKAFAERQKARKENLVKFAKEVVANKGFESLSAEAKKFFNDCANPVVRTAGGSNQSFINKVFGDAPKVGDSITLIDYMKKTFKSKADLDKAVKAWAEKGIVVEFKAAANQLESTYTIKALPTEKK